MPDTKSALRAEMQARRSKLASAPNAHAAAHQLAANLVQKLSWQTPDVIAGYWPLPSELDLRPGMAALHSAGAGIALPVMLPGNQLLFRRWRPEDLLKEAQFGVQEPLDSATEVTPTIVLVPLLAFDRCGSRLGHGAGYYDRALEHLRAAGATVALGCAFSEQEVEKIPAEPHDQPLDGVVTELDLIWFGRKSDIEQ